MGLAAPSTPNSSFYLTSLLNTTTELKTHRGLQGRLRNDASTREESSSEKQCLAYALVLREGHAQDGVDEDGGEDDEGGEDAEVSFKSSGFIQ